MKWSVGFSLVGKIGLNLLIVMMLLSETSCTRQLNFNSYSNEKWIKASHEIEGSDVIVNLSFESNEKKSLEKLPDFVDSKSILENQKNISRKQVNRENQITEVIKKKVIKVNPSVVIKAKENPKYKNQLAVDGFILALVGLLLPIPILNVILIGIGFNKGLKALRQFKAEPDKYKGKGFAIAAVCIGITVILVTIIALGLILSM